MPSWEIPGKVREKVSEFEEDWRMATHPVSML